MDTVYRRPKHDFVHYSTLPIINCFSQPAAQFPRSLRNLTGDSSDSRWPPRRLQYSICCGQDAWETEKGGGGEELVGAKDSVDAAEASGKISGTTTWQAFVQVRCSTRCAHESSPCWGIAALWRTYVLSLGM